MKISTKKRTDIIVSEIVLIVVSFIFVLPLILAFTMSLQPPQAVFSFPPKILPVGIHLQNYVDAFKTVPFGRLFLNSTIVAIMITAGKLITGTLAGYAFANFKFFGKSFTFSFLFATLFLPAETVPAMITPQLLAPSASINIFTPTWTVFILSSIVIIKGQR